MCLNFCYHLILFCCSRNLRVSAPVAQCSIIIQDHYVDQAPIIQMKASRSDDCTITTINVTLT